MAEDQERKLILDSLKNKGAAAEVEIQADTLLPLEPLRRAIKELADDGMVTIQEGSFRQFGGLVKLTPKGMSRSRNP